MPAKEYDPRKYGPTAVVAPSPALRGSPLTSVADTTPTSLPRRGKKKLKNPPRIRSPNVVIRQTPGEGTSYPGSAGDSSPSVVIPLHKDFWDDRLSLPEDVLSAVEGGKYGAADSSPGLKSTTKGRRARAGSKQRQRSSHADNCLSTATTADPTPNATPRRFQTEEERGRSRRRSVSWHCRERVSGGHKEKSCNLRQSCDAGLRGRRNDAWEKGKTRGKPSALEEENASDGVGIGKTRRGETIDAELLYRRKKKFVYNLTYGGWAASYDRMMAERASLERKRRLEMRREQDLRRRKAEQEFEKWRSNHERSACVKGLSKDGYASASTEKDNGLDGIPGNVATGQRQDSLTANDDEHQRERWTATTGSGDHETRSHEVGYDDGGDDARAEVVKGISQSTDKAEGGEKNSPGNGKRMELGHGDILQERHESKSKINRVKSHADIAGTDEAEQRRMIQRAYRKWLDRKKKQARSERQAEKERDKQAETRRKLEASRRWKKRPMVCAYTYGAAIGAREWSCQEDDMYSATRNRRGSMMRMDQG